MTSFQRNAFLYSTIVAMGGFVFGLDAALISGTVNFISNEFNLTELELGMAVSAPGLGVLFALPLAGYASNKIGRKNTLIVIATLYLFSAISSALASSFWILVASRFIGGLAFSSITLASLYIGEIAPAKWRGKLVSMNQINIVLGLSTAYFVNYLILQSINSGAEWVSTLGMDKNNWRWMLGSEILPAFLWLILLHFIPRSPSWLIYKGRLSEAKKALLKLVPAVEITAEVNRITESLKSSEQGQSILSQIKETLSKPMRTILIIAVTIGIAQQATGINAIMFYAPTVIEQLGGGTDAAFLQAIWLGLTSIVFTILSLLLIDKLGRRPMIIWGMVWIVISLMICSYGFKTATYSLTNEAIEEMSEIPEVGKLKSMVNKVYESDLAFKNALIETIGHDNARNYSGVLIQKSATINAILILIGIISFVAAFHFSVGPIMWVLFSEMFPISLRGTAIPLFALLTSAVSYLVQQFFPWQLANMGIGTIFMSYAIMVTVGLVILYKYLPETKNLTIEEIQKLMLR